LEKLNERIDKAAQRPREQHTASQRREAMQRHREHHERKNIEGRMEEMHRRFEKRGDDVRKDKLDKLMDTKRDIRDNVVKLQKMDENEHNTARRKHIKQLSKGELRVDMEELKRKAKAKMELLSDKLGVNELLSDPRMEKIRKGLIRGGEGTFHGDEGKPLPPEGRHALYVFFGLFGLVGLIRYIVDLRRKARLKKGHRHTW
jgi:hypothetical protein